MGAKLQIVCVDDEPDIRTILVAALDYALDAEVTALASGEELLAYLRDHPAPDLVVLDGLMPGLDGYQTCRAVRDSGRHDDLPVVFLTARAAAADRQRALDAGATVCLAKPFDPVTIGPDIMAALDASTSPQRS